MTSHAAASRTDGVLPSIAAAIGNTPLVALNNLTRDLDGRILAKLEMMNPGTSKKDRIALRIIEEAEAAGLLVPGATIVELTSGSTGTGVALVCAARGYRFIAVMSEGNSKERAVMMRALGADVVLVGQAPGSTPGQVSGDDLKLVEERTQLIVEELGAFRIDQFNRPGNSAAHQFGTGPEIWDASQGSITAFCDFVGSGGTFAGLWRAFKERNSEVRGYVVEPQSAAVLAGDTLISQKHKIQGGGYAMPDLPLLEGITPDGFVKVSDREAVEMARRLACEEGIFAGYSAGANVAAAMKLLQGSERGGDIAVIICDTGLKYMSNDLWTGEP